MKSTSRPPITDSPWLWAAFFTGVGLAGPLATGGSSASGRPASRTSTRPGRPWRRAEIEPDPNGVRAMPVGEAPAYSTAGEDHDPAVAARNILGVACAGSVGMLVTRSGAAMNWLCENPSAIVVVEALAALMAGIVFQAKRTGAALAALVAVIVATAALLAVERFVKTDREQVRVSLHDMLEAIEANDVRRCSIYRPGRQERRRRCADAAQGSRRRSSQRFADDGDTVSKADAEAGFTTSDDPIPRLRQRNRPPRRGSHRLPRSSRDRVGQRDGRWLSRGLHGVQPRPTDRRRRQRPRQSPRADSLKKVAWAHGPCVKRATIFLARPMGPCYVLRRQRPLVSQNVSLGIIRHSRHIVGQPF